MNLHVSDYHDLSTIKSTWRQVWLTAPKGNRLFSGQSNVLHSSSLGFLYLIKRLMVELAFNQTKIDSHSSITIQVSSKLAERRRGREGKTPLGKSTGWEYMEY